MGRRGGQLRGNPCPAARHGSSGDRRRPGAGSVSGPGSGLGPLGARLGLSSDRAGSRAYDAAPGLLPVNPRLSPPCHRRAAGFSRSLSACEAGVSVAGPGALAPCVKFPARRSAELTYIECVFAGVIGLLIK